MRSSDQAHFVPWQDVLLELFLFRVELTKKSMLDSTQRVFELGDKNGRFLAWLARGQHTDSHL